LREMRLANLPRRFGAFSCITIERAQVVASCRLLRHARRWTVRFKRKC
jgi:hypothetical protein